MKRIKPWLLIIAYAPLVVTGGLILVILCAIFGTSERVPVKLFPKTKSYKYQDWKRRNGL